jgi:hypothetical protein
VLVPRFDALAFPHDATSTLVTREQRPEQIAWSREPLAS